jgi:olefin beta-lactone synthetase
MADNQNDSNRATHLNIARHLRGMAKNHPYQRAVVFPATRDAKGQIAYTHYTFRQLDQESDRLAAGLENIGIRKGIRTVLMVRPSLDFFALTFALFKSGAVPVMVDPGMGIKRLIRCLKESQSNAFIGISKAHALRVLFPKYFKAIKYSVTVGRRWFWGGHTLSSLMETPWRPYTMADTQSDDTAAILFTTGSTGPAKGVVYTHGIFDAQIQAIRTHFGIEPGEVDLPTFPLFALFAPALGMTAVIPDMDPTRPGFVNPKRIREAIVNHGVTNMFASPALLNRVGAYWKQKKAKFPSIKRVVSAGAPVSPSNIEQFSTLLNEQAEIHTPYGATEAMPVTSIGSKEILHETKTLSHQGYGNCVGKPLSGISLHIIKITDSPIAQWTDNLVLTDGEIGEIVVQGKNVTRHYYQRPRDDETSKIIDGNHFWHRMGDLGWRDNNGRIWFCGRKNHRVITDKGVLFTIPSEAIFNQHRHVFRSALIGIGQANHKTPVICIEPYRNNTLPKPKQFRKELLDLSKKHVHTAAIETILFHKQFPVDIRHNSKIFREELAVWASKKIKL